MSGDELITPFDVEKAMIELNDHIEKAPKVVKQFHSQLRTARAEYKKAFNIAYQLAEGSQMDRKVTAERECEKLQDDLDLAEVEYRFVSDLLDTYKTKLRALQSIGSMMRAQMFNPQGGA